MSLWSILWRLRRDIPRAWVWCLVDRRGLLMTSHLTCSTFSGVLVVQGLGAHFGAHEPVVQKLCSQLDIVFRLETLPRGGKLKHQRKTRFTATTDSLLRKNSSTANTPCSTDYVAMASGHWTGGVVTDCQDASETSRPPTMGSRPPNTWRPHSRCTVYSKTTRSICSTLYYKYLFLTIGVIHQFIT